MFKHIVLCIAALSLLFTSSAFADDTSQLFIFKKTVKCPGLRQVASTLWAPPRSTRSLVRILSFSWDREQHSPPHQRNLYVQSPSLKMTIRFCRSANALKIIQRL